MQKGAEAGAYECYFELMIDGELGFESDSRCLPASKCSPYSKKYKGASNTEDLCAKFINFNDLNDQPAVVVLRCFPSVHEIQVICKQLFARLAVPAYSIEDAVMRAIPGQILCN